MAERILQELEEEVACPICLGECDNPKILHCLHVFCLGCIRRCTDRNAQGVLMIPCPKCRQETPVPADGVEALISAFHINRLLEILKKSRQEQQPPEAGEAQPQPQAEEQEEKEDKRFCSLHADEELKLYCETCGVLICWKCAYVGAQHHNHDHSFLEEAFERYKDEVTASKELIEKQMAKVSKALQCINVCETNVKSQYETIKAAIHQNARKMQLMTQLERLTKSKLSTLLAKSRSLKNMESQLKGCLDFIRNTVAIDSQSHHEVLEMKATVVKQIKELTDPLKSEHHDRQKSSFDTFDVDYFPEIMLVKVHTPDDNRIQQRMGSTTELFAYPATDRTQSYQTALLRLPIAYYYHTLTGIILTGNLVQQRPFPGLPTPPAVDPGSLLRRPRHDTFRPPLGQPIYYLTGVGYGKEVGLVNGQHEVYDPFTQRNIILDHKTLTLVTQDPRPRTRQKTVVQPQMVLVASSPNVLYNKADLFTETMLVKATAERARSKQVGFTLSARGQNGSVGTTGQTGSIGADGANGMKGDSGFMGIGSKRDGQHGKDGREGGRGENGGRGSDGSDASDVFVHLSGSADELQVMGSREVRVRLGGINSEQVLLVDCHGGDGGKGGVGGRGGAGGRGGNGGNGAKGDSSSVPGQDGGNGGNGGSGGDGGFGGRGGDAGDGGGAGSGGSCLIRTDDPKLLVLVEADCMPGEPGVGVKGGAGGAGGKPGVGGAGGPGGKGGPPTTSDSGSSRATYSGHSGCDGSDGNRGRDGASGRDSKRGRKGQVGGILWVVDCGGKTLKSSTRYDAKVQSLDVVPTKNDGIFEPNERITVSGVVVCNTGGLDLPSGAVAFMPSTATVKFEPSRFSMPVIMENKKYTIPFKFHGRIFDAYPPNQPGPQSFKADLHTQIELLGRPFEKSFYIKEIFVQYPIKLGELHSPKLMDRGETSLISIEVKNISSAPYGNCRGTGGRVVLHLHFDSRLIPLGKVAADADAPYEVTYNHDLPDSTFVELHNISPKETIAVNIKVLLEKHAELFDQCNWQVDLRLRDKLIEYNHQSIRVTPTYNPRKPPANALLVTNDCMTHNEFVFWHHLFDSLGTSIDVWDTSQYSGFSVDTRTGVRHRESWYGRYTSKMIVYPHCDLGLFSAVDIAQHFHGDEFRQKPLNELDSSLVLFMPHSGDSEMAVLRHLATVHPKVELAENAYSGTHFTRPNPDKVPPPYAKCEKKIIKKLEEKNLSQAPVLCARQTDIEYLKRLSYSYGSIDIRELPILKSSKFLLVDEAGYTDSTVAPFNTDIQLGSKCGQAILAIIYGLSIQAKLRLIKRQQNADNIPQDYVFFLPDGSLMGREELVMICLAWEVADEPFNCSGEAFRMRQFHDDVMGHTYAYLECGQIVLRGLKLIDGEFHKRRQAGLKHFRVMQAYKKISAMSKAIQEALLEAEVNGTKLENMLSLDQLQDSSRVHRCHQHFVKEEKWNLVDN